MIIKRVEVGENISAYGTFIISGLLEGIGGSVGFGVGGGVGWDVGTGVGAIVGTGDGVTGAGVRIQFN